VPPPPPSLKGRALRLLATREHARAELERKLRRHEVEPGALGKVLDELQAKGFIDTQRVVDSVVHQRAGKLGVARIRQELQHRGVAGDEAAVALAALQATELARARQVWRKKFGRGDGDGSDAGVPDGAQRARQMRFLAARGFTGDTIRRVVSGVDDFPDEPPSD
jgi:regulatory protein